MENNHNAQLGEHYQTIAGAWMSLFKGYLKETEFKNSFCGLFVHDGGSGFKSVS